MALPATLVWENRPANGTANAGGSFDPSVASPGTDYSQQNAVQIAYTDLVIGNPATTELTSAANPFGAAHVGNSIAITSGTGFTLEIFNIRSVTGTTATMDRAVGTAGSTGGNGNLGGARSGYSVGTKTMQSSLVAGNNVHTKNEAWNEAVTLTVAGTAGNPITHEGYNLVRGDAPLDANMPRNNRAAAAGIAWNTQQAGQIIKHLWMSNAGTNGFNNGASSISTYWFCRGSNNGGDGFFTQGVHIGCESFSNTSDGEQVPSVGNYYFLGWYAHDNSGAGLNMSSATVFATQSILEANASHGIISTTAIINLNGLTVDGNTGATTDGWSSTTPGLNSTLTNSIFSNNGDYGVSATDGDSVSVNWNNYDANTTGARNNFPTGDNDQALASQFTNRAGGDFSIGVNLKALGFPGAFPGATSTGYLDIGAVQRREARPITVHNEMIIPPFEAIGY